MVASLPENSREMVVRQRITTADPGCGHQTRNGARGQARERCSQVAVSPRHCFVADSVVRSCRLKLITVESA